MESLLCVKVIGSALALAFLLTTGCESRSRARPLPPTSATASASLPSASAAPAPSPRSPRSPPDAGLARGPSVEDRKRYLEALKAGRGHTAARKYAAAIEDFTRALAAIPWDPRALAERGFARHLLADDDGAKSDLELAASSTGPSDSALEAQVEFNLGLVCESLATRAEDGALYADPMRGVAVGHFRRSNSLRPTKAAAAKMGGCPASWGPFKVATYASLVEAKAHVGAKDGTIDHDDAGRLRFHDEGAWTDAGSNGVVFDERSTGTSVLLPLAQGRYAHVDVGAVLLGRCGRLGEIDLRREAGAWRVTYQAHKALPGHGPAVCFCDGEASSGACEPAVGDAERSDLPPCPCADPVCPMTCGDEDEQAGPHLELYVDEKGGAGLWRTEVDHAYVDQVTLAVDLQKRRFEASGLGCEASVRLPAPQPPRPGAFLFP